MIIVRDRSFYRSLILLALPIALQNLSTFAIGLTDTLMLRSLGDVAIAGVYLATTVQTLVQIFTTGVESAILILCTQYWGRGDTESICRTTAIGWYVSLLFGLAVTLPCALCPAGVLSLFTTEVAAVEHGAPYLSLLALSFPLFCLTQVLIAAMRSAEATVFGAVLSTLSLAINLIFNLLLIFGRGPLPALGARGAALATLITRLLELTGAIFYVLLRDRRLRLRPSHLRQLSLPLLRDFARYGAPVMLGQLVWAANMLLSTAIMGRQGADTVAGLAVANTVNSLSYILINGMAAAVGILTGKAIGSGNTPQLRSYAYTAQLLFLALGLLTAGAIFLFCEPLISLYRLTAPAAERARAMIRVLGVTVVGTAYQSVCLGGLIRSGGDTPFVLRTDAILVLCLLPIAWLATRLQAPPFLIYACLKSDQLLKCPIAAVKVNRFHWVRHLTRTPTSGAPRP